MRIENGASDIDGELRHPRIGGPGPVFRGPREAEYAGTVLDDNRRIPARTSTEQPLDRLSRSRLGLKRGRAVLDALVVDLRDRGCVTELHETDVQLGSHFLSIL